MIGKGFLFKSDNIQVSFALSPKKQEILATQKDKILQKKKKKKKVLEGMKAFGNPKGYSCKKSVHL